MEIIQPAGAESFEVMGDVYRLNSLRWFEYNAAKYYTIKETLHDDPCPKCMDPNCIIFTNTDSKINKITNEVKFNGEGKTNKQLRFMSYRLIARARYGHFPKGCPASLAFAVNLLSV